MRTDRWYALAGIAATVGCTFLPLAFPNMPSAIPLLGAAIFIALTVYFMVIGEGRQMRAIIGIGVVFVFAIGLTVFYFWPGEPESSDYCVNIHLRENDKVLLDAVNKIVADMGFRNCHETLADDKTPKHLQVEYFDKKARPFCSRLATRVKEELPQEFGAIQVNPEDPKYGGKDQIGLWLLR
jgi:hypothetical protein